MSELLHGMGIASGILIPVVVLIIVCSMAAVKRGEAAMRGEVYGISPELRSYVPGVAGTATVAAKEKPAAVVITEDPTVMEIVLLGVGLFVLTVLVLMGVSFISHM